MSPFEDQHQSLEDALAVRLPNEQIMVLDCAHAAEAYLSMLNAHQWEVIREDFPNSVGLYARYKQCGQVVENKIYVQG